LGILKSVSIAIYEIVMVKTKIIGKEKCPHIGKDGKQCNKPGRYNPNPKVSWNNKRKLDKKREYAQFIHNDGTRHNIGSFMEYRLDQIKGHPSEQTLKKLYQLSSSLHLTADRINRVAEKNISNWPMTQAEEMDLTNGFKYWIELVEEMPKLETRELIAFFQKAKLLHENKIDPLAASMSELFNKYERPARLKKRKSAYKDSQDLKSDRYQNYFIE
jgi:hypothetical protein